MSNRKRAPKFPVEQKIQLPEGDTPESIFSSARLAAVSVMNICAPAIRALFPIFLDPEKGPTPGTMGVDKHYRCYVCIDALKEWVALAKSISPENPCETCGDTYHHDIAYVGGVICHEACHPLREHHDRAANIMAVNNLVWNVSADEEINDDLLEIFAKSQSVKLCIPYSHLHIPKRWKHEDGKLAETYYLNHIENISELVKQQQQTGTCQGQGKNKNGPGEHSWNPNRGDPNDHGSAADGQDKPWDQGPPEDGKSGLSEAETRMIKKSVAERIQKELKSRSDIPGGFQRWAEEVLAPPKYDWRQEMRKVLRHATYMAHGDEERTYRRLGRRCAALDYKVIFPNTYTPKPVVMIVQDTSGSMGDHTIGECFVEAEGIIKAAGGQVKVIMCDMQPDKAQTVSSVKQINVSGGGGTDMTIGIRAALEEKPRPNLIVLFTDGYTPWPSAPLPFGTRLIVGLVGQHSADINEPPQWATAIRITGDDVTVRKGV